MALRVGPIPQKCNMSNHGIAHKITLLHETSSGVKLMMVSREIFMSEVLSILLN